VLIRSGNGGRFAVDVRTGAPSPLPGLPRLPFTDAQFLDEKRGAAIFAGAGLAVTADGGASWKVGVGHDLHDLDRRGDALFTASVAPRQIDLDAGRLLDRAPPDAGPLGTWIAASSGREPLWAALTFGVPVPEGGSIVVDNGVAIRVDLNTGAILELVATPPRCAIASRDASTLWAACGDTSSVPPMRIMPRRLASLTAAALAAAPIADPASDGSVVAARRATEKNRPTGYGGALPIRSVPPGPVTASLPSFWGSAQDEPLACKSRGAGHAKAPRLAVAKDRSPLAAGVFAEAQRTVGQWPDALILHVESHSPRPAQPAKPASPVTTGPSSPSAPYPGSPGEGTELTVKWSTLADGGRAHAMTGPIEDPARAHLRTAGFALAGAGVLVKLVYGANDDRVAYARTGPRGGLELGDAGDAAQDEILSAAGGEGGAPLVWLTDGALFAWPAGQAPRRVLDLNEPRSLQIAAVTRDRVLLVLSSAELTLARWIDLGAAATSLPLDGWFDLGAIGRSPATRSSCSGAARAPGLLRVSRHLMISIDGLGASYDVTFDLRFDPAAPDQACLARYHGRLDDKGPGATGALRAFEVPPWRTQAQGLTAADALLPLRCGPLSVMYPPPPLLWGTGRPCRYDVDCAAGLRCMHSARGEIRDMEGARQGGGGGGDTPAFCGDRNHPPPPLP
jgi:hypothetical protein